MTPLHTIWIDEHARQLAWLLSGGDAGLDGGAELEVRHHDGAPALRAALARHHRAELPDLVWIRPLAGGHTHDPAEAGQPPYAFDLDLARRRSLHITAVRSHGDELGLDLATGQTAVIRPAASDTFAELQRWDTWYYTACDAATQHELDALDHDP